MIVAARTDPGRVRENNEDYYIVDTETSLFIVADGVGGNQGGEVASKLGADVIQRIVKKSLAGQSEQFIEGIIKDAFDNAHKEIVSLALDDQHLVGMGTTIVLGLYEKNRLYVAHVGDSRAYLLSSERMTPLTEDHSVVTALMREGRISKKEALNHDMRHVITQCLGCPQYFGPDIRNVDYNNKDLLLLCSDGLTDMLEDREIQEIIQKGKNDLQECTEKLIKMANDRGGRDNITVVLVRNNRVSD